jgi:pimeloyl-ACP methyl ester carboxylesterase
MKYAMGFLAAMLATVCAAQSHENVAAASPSRAGVAPVWEEFAPRYQPHICPFHGEAKFDADIVECGSVLVPEDRTNPDSRLIRLSVMRVKSSDANPPGGTVVRLEGGPGVSSITSGRAEYYSGPEAAKLRAVAHHVFFDQRGVGYSEPAFCRAVASGFAQGEAMGEKADTLTHAAMRRCLDEARAQGIQIHAYSNWENALDVRDLRRALGLKQWTIFGISYGTQLGQGVMLVDREGTRAAILDSVAPAEVIPHSPNAAAANFRNSLDALARACSAQPACTDAYPDLRGRFYDVIRAYGSQPLLIDGVSQSVTLTGRIVANDKAVAAFIFQLLFSRSMYQDLPVLLHALETRDVVALRSYVEAYPYQLNHRFGTGMAVAINCQSGRLDRGSGLDADPEIAETAKWFGADSTVDPRALCDLFNLTTPDVTTSPLRSDIPTLVVAGATDTVTPAADARSIMSGLPRATYVEFPFTGHAASLTSGDCGKAILTAFIADPAATPSTDCIKDITAPIFLTSWRATPKAFRFLTSLQAGARPIFPIAVIVGLAFAVIAYPLAAIARRMDRRRGLERESWRMLRLVSWAGALVSLAGLALAAKMIMDWSTDHLLAVPLGLPESIAYAGLTSLAGLLVASYAAIRAWTRRKGGAMPVGTLAGTTMVALCALGALAFLFSIGSGPIVL